MIGCLANRLSKHHYERTDSYRSCGKPTVAEIRGRNDAEYDVCEGHAWDAHDEGMFVRWYEGDAPTRPGWDDADGAA